MCESSPLLPHSWKELEITRLFCYLFSKNTLNQTVPCLCVCLCVAYFQGASHLHFHFVSMYCLFSSFFCFVKERLHFGLTFVCWMDWTPRNCASELEWDRDRKKYLRNTVYVCVWVKECDSCSSVGVRFWEWVWNVTSESGSAWGELDLCNAKLFWFLLLFFY